MKRAIFFVLLLSLYLIPQTTEPHEGKIYMAKAHLPNLPGQFKISTEGLTEQEKRLLEFALKQWVMYDTAPSTSKKGNRGSTGSKLMAAGPDHASGNKHFRLPDRSIFYGSRSQRSISETERAMMKARYDPNGDGNPFHKPGQPVLDPTTPGGRAGWFVDTNAEAHIKMQKVDKVPGYTTRTLGLADYKSLPAKNDKQWKSVQPASTGNTGTLYLKKKPKGKEWCYPTDTNQDGWITNEDTPCPPNTKDWYMIVKHELGHFFSFLHQGKDYTEHTDGPPEQGPPMGVGTLNSPDNEGGTALGKEGEQESGQQSRLYFHSDRPGGQGGFDIWYSVYDADLEQWGQPVNCGGSINSPDDELDPHSGYGDSFLYFASNRPGGQGGFDLYMATRFDTTTWDSVWALNSLNSPADEFDPHEWGDEVFLFSSNRPGGQGNNDIWFASLQDTFNFLWNTPQNLVQLNSVGNDEDPYIGYLEGGDSIGVVYYSSDRPGGQGGFDIYYSMLTAGVWGAATSVGNQVNTAENEKGPEIDQHHDWLYYESDLPQSLGGWDILASPNERPRPHVLWSHDDWGLDTLQVGFVIFNEGLIPLIIDPVVTSNDGSWPLSWDATPLFLNPGESQDYFVDVVVPITANLGDELQIYLTAIAGPASAVDTARAWAGGPTGIDDDTPIVAHRNELFQNRPNPFNPSTTIRYSLANNSFVQLSIYDVAGRLVRTLVNEESQQAGPHNVEWDSRDNSGRLVASGVYFYRLQTSGFTQTRKMILLR